MRRAAPLLPLVALSLLLGAGRQPALRAQTWVLGGPAPSINGQPENIPDSPIAGAVEAVVAHPTDADILWIGSVNGGIFRTDNATAASPSWTPQTDDQASLAIGALELDPTDVSHDTLVAGVGNTSSYGRRGGVATGILRTTNGGTTWTPLGSDLAGLNISGVAPRGATIVAAVADGSIITAGIYRSTDTGATFVQISAGAGTGLPRGRAWDLASDPTSTSRLFTIIRDTATPGSSGIYRSDDSGATWIKVSNATQDAQLNLPSGDANLAVGRAGPGITTNVYAAICSGSPNDRLVGLYRSGDAGSSWTTLDLPETVEQGTAYGIHPGTQCTTHLSLVADPVDSEVVFIGGDRQPANNENGMPGVQFPNSIGASTYGGRLFRVDAGQSPGSQATPITNCGTALAGCGGSARTANDTAPHADSREMVFDANGDLVQVDDGGVYRHTDPNGTTGDWVSVIGNLAAVEQHSMALDGTSDILFSGNQDNGTTRQQTPGGVVWREFQGGDGGDVTVAEDDPVAGQSTRYASSQFFGLARRLVYNSSNGFLGSTFLDLTPLGGSPAPTFQFTTPLEVNAAVPTRLILGAANGTYESSDRLDSVIRISTAVVNDDGRGPIAYGVAGSADALYFGSGDDVYVRTAAPPTAPVATDPDAASGDFIVGVVIDPASALTAFAIDEDQVFRTTNAGGGWTDVTGNLQSLDPGTLRSVEYIDAGGDRLVVGGSTGVFVATEAAGFASWTQLGTGLPNAPVFDLDYDAGGDVLAAGTLGRGTWLLTFAAGCVPDTFEPDDTSGQASSIGPGTPQAHNICPVGDEDWATFTLAAESGVVLETSGPSGDTGMWLRDSGLGQIEFDDNGGTGLFSRIDRSCGVDALAAGTYYVEVGEVGDNDEIASYDLSLSATACVCPPDLTLASQTLSGTQTFNATGSVTLGPALIVDGTDISVAAPTVKVLDTTELGGTVQLDNSPVCP